jgi:hypothetical protein
VPITGDAAVGEDLDPPGSRFAVFGYTWCHGLEMLDHGQRLGEVGRDTAPDAAPACSAIAAVAW